MADIKNIRRGDTKKYKVHLRNEETGENIPANGTLTFTLKSDVDLADTEAELQASVTRNDDDINTPDGLLFLIVTAAETKIDIGSYFYDFQFVSDSGEVTTILPRDEDEDEGKVQILPEVTKTV
ncbi:MAG: hypothetical protein DRH10_01035 [Deltaproteobacteria bacterium]|nr:MAG: hypothetical protein DRH10_01035 [Deltaproteobacteria bacterium]